MMQATSPYVDVPGDREDRIMARSGDLVGMTSERVVWRYGFLPGSEAAGAYGVAIAQDDSYGFLWALATRKTGKLLETWRGYALDMPAHFRKVVEG